MSYQLGVDLGTTYTAAAVVADGGSPEVANLGSRAAAIPSVVYLRAEDDAILTGEAATRRAVAEPDRVAREFKRRVGDPTPIILGGVPYSAHGLMAKLLGWVVDAVALRHGTSAAHVCVCHPANWGPYKRELLEQALHMAGLDRASMLTEPEAAAVHYASNERVTPGDVVAVYDLGGGTFDAAVLRRTERGFDIVGRPEGIESLGGIDFDRAVLAHVDRSLDGAVSELDPADPAALAAVARLRQDCVEAKEALSSDTDVSIPVFLPTIQTEVRLTRAEFEAMVRPPITETIDALRRALRSAEVDPADVRAVLLVGGSSRIPLVAQMVSAELRRPIAVDADPKFAIAKGAALQAAVRAGAPSTEGGGRVPTGMASAPAPPPRPAAPAPPARSPTVVAPAPSANPAPPSAPVREPTAVADSPVAPAAPPRPPTQVAAAPSPTAPPPRSPTQVAAAPAAPPAPVPPPAPPQPPSVASSPPSSPPAAPWSPPAQPTPAVPGPFAAPPIPPRFQPPQPGAPGRGRRTLVIAAIAALVLIGGGVGAFLLLSGDGEEPGADATTAPPGTPPAGGTARLAWQQLEVPAFGGEGEQVIRALIDRGGDAGAVRFVATGAVDASGAQDAGVWTSSDGATWTLVEDEDLGGAGNQRMTSSAIVRGVLVAGGSDDASGTNDAAVWRSTDGVQWERISDDDLGGDGNQSIGRIKNTSAGLLATGSDTSTGDPDGAIWISADGGESWDRVPDPGGALGGEGEQQIERIVNSDPIVAVGSEVRGEDRDAAVWVSDDGVTWTRLPDDAGVFGGEGEQQINDASQAGDVILAVGSDDASGDREGVLWVSRDGLQWSRLDDPDRVFGGPGDQSLLRIVVAKAPPQGLPAHVIVGLDAAADEGDAAVWLSDDGQAWARESGVEAFAGDGEQIMLAATADDFPAVAAGADSSSGDRDAAVWIAAGQAAG